MLTADQFEGPSANYLAQQVSLAIAALAPLARLGADVEAQGLRAMAAVSLQRLEAIAPPTEAAKPATKKR